MSRRRIAVLTTGRQDWGILRSTCALLRDDNRFELLLIAGGMHLSPAFGSTIQSLRAEGFEPARELAWVDGPEGTDPRAAFVQAGDAAASVGGALEELAPDALLLLGDRFETASAALAATLCRIPLVHLHGGEETEGAFDNAIRHAITKLSHLHLVSHPKYARRVIEMGENPSAVHVVGAPGLDNLHRTDLPSREALEERLGLPLVPPVVLVTLHPSTLGGDPRAEADALVAAMDDVAATYVITLPNVDPGQRVIRERLEAAGRLPRRVAVPALGEQRYWAMLRSADAMLGNSSSGLIEAPAAHLPAVNIGERQKGRLRGANVIDVAAEPGEIAAGLQQALSPCFREQCRRAPSPFGDGHSGAEIVEILGRWTPPDPPVKKGVWC